MLIDQAPAPTLGYMIAGYAVIFSVMLLYLASLAVRWRRLQEELHVLEKKQ